MAYVKQEIVRHTQQTNQRDGMGDDADMRFGAQSLPEGTEVMVANFIFSVTGVGE